MRRAALAFGLVVSLAACGTDAHELDAGVADAAAGADAGDVADAAPGPDAIDSFVGVLHGRVTSAGAPVADAIVRFAGRPEQTLTALDGSFALSVGEPAVVLHERALAAGREGYWNRGLRVRDPGLLQEIELTRVDLVDNPGYAFKSPDASNTTPHCLHCHKKQTADWQTSAHAHSASDPMLADLYNGSASGFSNPASCVAQGGRWQRGRTPGAATAQMKCYLGPGVLPDLNPGRCGGAGQPACDDPEAAAAAQPSDASVCAGCHAPVMVASMAGTTDLNLATGVAYDAGVSCDFCHKIQRVQVNQRPGVLGAVTLQRPAAPPSEGGFSEPETTFGPYSDAVAFFMGSTYQPQFRRSELCSACHQWSEPGLRAQDRPLVDRDKWPDGFPIQDTYDEWRASSWATRGVECQHCHMPASTASNAVNDEHNLPPSTAGVIGFERAYGELRRHLFAARLGDEPGWSPPPGEPELALLRDPLELGIDAHVGADGALSVNVRLGNVGAGHAIPSGTPTRALFLLVGAQAGDAPLAPVGGQTLPEWAGARAGVTIGADATLLGTSLTRATGWPADVTPGATVRIVRATGSFADDPGTGWFGNPARTPAEKGLAIAAPVAETTVTAIVGNTLVLADAPAVLAGDRVLIGDAALAGALAPDQAFPERALAGAAGWAFGKVMAGADGTRYVPFFEAVDIAADNRIPAGASVTTTHTFAPAPAGSAAPIRVTVTLLYRRHAWSQAHLRGWNASDVVRVQRTVEVH